MKNGSHNVPQPPSHLSAFAHQWWVTATESYQLEEHHLRLLQLACEAWDRAQMTREQLQCEGLTLPGREGGVRPHLPRGDQDEGGRQSG
jgi:phage terminase small subunit